MSCDEYLLRKKVPRKYKEHSIFEKNKCRIKWKDSKQRLQYAYDNKDTNNNNRNKYNKLIKFVDYIDIFKNTIYDLLDSTSFGEKNNTIAWVFYFMLKFKIRVGNEEYTIKNGSYGITQLKVKHVRKKKDYFQIIFSGKSGQFHKFKVKNKEMIESLNFFIKNKSDDDLLFTYLEKKEILGIKPKTLNKFLQKKTKKEFTLKDLRTFYANKYFLRHIIKKTKKPHSHNEVLHNIDSALNYSAKKLGHKQDTSKKSYTLFLSNYYLSNSEVFYDRNDDLFEMMKYLLKEAILQPFEKNS